MVEEEVYIYRRQFSFLLRPYFDMWDGKSNTMDSEDWAMMVLQLEKSILKNPEQYLGRDLPPLPVVNGIVREIFEDFLQEH